MAEDSPADFPTPSMDDWRVAAEKALRGKPLESITWQTDDGFELPPVVEDVEAPASSRRERPGVQLCASVAYLGDLPRFREVIEHELEHGPDLLLIEDPEHLDAVPDSLPPARTLIAVDPWGRDVVRWARAASDGHVAGLVIEAGEKEETAALQIAYAVGRAIGFLRSPQLALAGVTASDLCDRLILKIEVTPAVITEVAKLRAIRRVWDASVRELGFPAELQPRILAMPSSFTETRLEPHTNLLRSTLALFAAICGGASIVEPNTFDALIGGEDECTSVRLAQNQVKLLLEEAYVAHVDDPMGGARAVEALTAELTEVALRYVEPIANARGDLLNEFQDRQREVAMERIIDETRRRERVVVGINRFADPARDGAMGDSDDRSWPYEGCEGDDEEVARALGMRQGMAFEWLRERVLSHVDRGNDRPAAMLLPLGDARKRRHRADFAAEFFRCGGFDVIDPWAFDTVDAAIAAAADARVVVICADDATYPDAVPAIAAALPNALVYVAGKPTEGLDVPDLDVPCFVYQGVDAVDVLSDALDRLGVGRIP